MRLWSRQWCMEVMASVVGTHWEITMTHTRWLSRPRGLPSSFKSKM
ncbi:hypothetical protein MUK42_30835 [Musa troglodytarum]|uniref:Uncharacterized protein n=1 Tax=Musa troglodytarum TaxID=320322 RepID=A0A9E7FNG9_9LILI|nr:hypothetical protein MUK42_30835 [Musa troglodytarum]